MFDVIRSYTKNKSFSNIYRISNGRIEELKAEEKDFLMLKEATANRLGETPFMLSIIGLITANMSITQDIMALILFFFSINVYLDEEDMHEMYLINRILTQIQKNDSKNKARIMGQIIDRQILYIDSKFSCDDECEGVSNP